MCPSKVYTFEVYFRTYSCYARYETCLELILATYLPKQRSEYTAICVSKMLQFRAIQG